MAMLVRNLTLGLDEPESELAALAAKKLGVSVEQIRWLRVVRKSLDARPRHMGYVFAVAVELVSGARPARGRAAARDVQPYHRPPRPTDKIHPGSEPLSGPPVIVGAGPAGLFGALLLAEAGYRPVLLERGRGAERRDADVKAFTDQRRLDPESNFLFGLGGAGAYSDGKLYTRTHDPLGAWIVEQFVAFGADPEIAVSGKPHVGSDKLPGICRNLACRIEALGGEVRFDCRVDEIEIADGTVRALQLADGERLETGCVLLGIGHSARDTYAMLARRGVAMSPKPFQMGLRIEHPQRLIDRAQLGEYADRPELTPADYHLVARGAAGDRDVFSFCMCPGGRVLPITTEVGTIGTNGGSTRARDSQLASAALVVTTDAHIQPSGGDPLVGLDLQRRIEQACFRAGGGDYTLCAQRVSDFLAGRASTGAIDTGSLTGARGCDFHQLLPESLCTALGRALEVFERRIPGFAGPDAVLLGPETRASSPVRIERDRERRASLSAGNLYPIGEGAGYAGGIVSAAVDGLRSAQTVIARYARR